jgi:hypothetical protein
MKASRGEGQEGERAVGASNFGVASVLIEFSVEPEKLV